MRIHCRRSDLSGCRHRYRLMQPSSGHSIFQHIYEPRQVLVRQEWICFVVVVDKTQFAAVGTVAGRRKSSADNGSPRVWTATSQRLVFDSSYCKLTRKIKFWSDFEVMSAFWSVISVASRNPEQCSNCWQKNFVNFYLTVLDKGIQINIPNIRLSVLATRLCHNNFFSMEFYVQLSHHMTVINSFSYLEEPNCDNLRLSLTS